MVQWSEDGLSPSPAKQPSVEALVPEEQPVEVAPPVSEPAPAVAQPAAARPAAPPPLRPAPKPPQERRPRADHGDQGAWAGFSSGLESNLDALAHGRPIRVARAVLEAEQEQAPGLSPES